MKILVADDEPHITHMLRFLFEKRGHEVVVAHDGDTALEYVMTEAPQVVFLDLNMPGKTGFQVCEELRARDQYRTLPIYILTAQGQDVACERSVQLGATDYFTKPFAPSALAALVESLESPDKG